MKDNLTITGVETILAVAVLVFVAGLLIGWVCGQSSKENE